MTLKRISTGIFQHLEASNPTREDAQLLSMMLNKALRIENWLAFYETRAGQNPESEDARHVLEYIRLVRTAVQDGDINRTAVESLQLGIFATIMDVRPQEKPAVTGRKVRRITADGRKSEALRLANERKEQERERWAQCAAEYRARRPNHSAWEVARYVKEKLKTPQKPDTIRRALRKITGKV